MRWARPIIALIHYEHYVSAKICSTTLQNSSLADPSTATFLLSLYQ